MPKRYRIKLTKKQIEILNPLAEKTIIHKESGKPGIMFMQFDDDLKHADGYFISEEISKKMTELTTDEYNKYYK